MRGACQIGIVVGLAAMVMAACGDGNGNGNGNGGADADVIAGWSRGVGLPVAVANNAVASVETADGCVVVTALGIGESLAAEGIGTGAAMWRVGDGAWTAAPDVPGGVGRVAASAVGLRGEVYVLGGYSVGAGGEEVSFDAVDAFDPIARTWRSAAPLSTPVDDAVAVAWRDRYIVVVSGWSNTGNVDAVQIYDADADAWSEATSFPGNAVFGHTGALVGDDLIVVDGVRSGIGGFALVNQAWRGRLDPQDPLSIEWSDLGGHPGPARYRAAGGTSTDEIALFHGGTDDPYNFDGRSYDSGQPSPPHSTTLAYDPDGGFVELPHDKPEATMDHRALARCGDVLLSVGGMTSGPVVTTDVWELRL